MLLTIDSCRQQLELTRQAALLSLLRFEQKWNPHGNNDAHLYEDMRNALVEANRHRVNEAKQQLLDRLLSFAYQCKSESSMKLTPSLQNATIGFLCIKYTGKWLYGKSGPIQCDKGFKVRFDLQNPSTGWNAWNDTMVILADASTPVSEFGKKAYSLAKK